MHSIIRTYKHLMAGIIDDYTSRKILTKHSSNDYLKTVLLRLQQAFSEPTFKVSRLVNPITFIIAKTDEICRGITLEEHVFVGKHIVAQYIEKGSFIASDKEDLLQFVLEEIINRSIIEKYKGEAKFTTYLWTCITNLLNEKYRSNKRMSLKEIHVDPYKLGNIKDEQNHNYLPLSEEERHQEMLETIAAYIRLIPALGENKRRRLGFCFLIDARICLRKEDILFFWKDCPPALINEVLGHFQNDYQDLPDKDVWSYLTAFLNNLENKQNSADAIRIWVKRMKNQIKYAA